MFLTGCSATRIWAVYRHGTRTPGPETMNGVNKRLIEIRDAIVRNNKKAGKYLILSTADTEGLKVFRRILTYENCIQERLQSGYLIMNWTIRKD